ncbi:hypothetical protein NL676_006704 [Syzygium grande]|nr:hypothetical protein NL676_006704 [Syzygium grande]
MLSRYVGLLANAVEDGLFQMADGDQVVALENGIRRVQDLSLGDGLSEDWWKAEARGRLRKPQWRGRRTRRASGAGVAIGHDGPHRAVVGDAIIAELHCLGCDSDVVGLVGRQRRGVEGMFRSKNPIVPGDGEGFFVCSSERWEREEKRRR